MMKMLTRPNKISSGSRDIAPMMKLTVIVSSCTPENVSRSIKISEVEKKHVKTLSSTQQTLGNTSFAESDGLCVKGPLYSSFALMAKGFITGTLSVFDGSASVEENNSYFYR